MGESEATAGGATGPGSTSALAVTAWVLVGASLLASVIGIFWMRLWLLGLPLGIAAFILCLVAAHREGSLRFVSAKVIAGVCALLLPVLIVVYWVVAFVVMPAAGLGAAKPQLQVDLSVEAEGEFRVVHTKAPVPGESVIGLAEVDATDRFDASIRTDQRSLQFFANVEAVDSDTTQMSCSVKINGTVVLENTGNSRFVECSGDLRNLYREKVAVD